MKLQIPLTWEKNHPERVEWSGALSCFVACYFYFLDKASDIETIRPDYRSLTKDQKINVWCELFCALAKYESDWNPKSEDVDVGAQSDKNTWSLGLCQLSQVDQESYGIHLGWTVDDFLDPIKNLFFCVRIIAHQIDKRGKLLIAPGEAGLYFATLHYPGGKYDKTAQISAMVQGLKFS
jgi:hypothetical protein